MSQSQTQSSLNNDDVSTWNQETCRQRPEEALTELTAEYCNGTTAPRKVAILKMMVDSLLPLLAESQREGRFLAAVLPETKSLFGSICSTILSALQANDGDEVARTLQQNLQLLIEIINSIESTIQQVMPPKGELVAMDTVESLPCNTLAVIQRSFSHCKESHTVYGEHFSAVSEPLSVLFKRAYSLQKALMALLEVLSGSCAGHPTSLSRVCAGFHDLCGILSGMDTTLLVSTWRFLVKLVSKHKAAIIHSFEASPLVDSLCREVETHYRHALEQAPRPPPQGDGGSQGGDERAFARTLKVCSLCFKMLHHVAKEFSAECLEQCAPGVTRLLLTLQSLVPPSLDASTMSQSAIAEIQRSVLVGVEPLIQLFMPSRGMCEVLLTKDEGQSSNQNLARILTLLTVLRLLPSATEEVCIQWLDPTLFPEDEPRLDLMSGIFMAAENSYVELSMPASLPGVMSGGKPQVEVSLYEFIVTGLCGFVAAIPPKCFGVVESCLFQNLLSEDWGRAMLAIDVWCFMARYGSASMCNQHVRFLLDFVTSLPTNQHAAFIHVWLLLSRLIPFMATDHQVDLISAYPVEECADLWSLLPLASLPDSTRSAVCEKLLKKCTVTINDWMETSGSGNRSHAVNVISSLQCAARMLAQLPRNQPVTDKLARPLATAFALLCAALSLDKLSASVLACLLDLASHILQYIQPALLSQLLQTSVASLKENTALRLRLACVNFLQRLAKRSLPSCPEQLIILEQIPILFGHVLSDANIVVHQQALEAFSSFAEETSHESVVPECIRQEQVESRVVDFLNQIPASAEILDSRSEEEWLRKQMAYLDRVRAQPKQQTLSESQLSSTGKGQTHAVPNIDAEAEPRSKQQQSDLEGDFRNAVERLKEALVDLGRLQDACVETPDWLDAELAKVKQSLDSLLGAAR